MSSHPFSFLGGDILADMGATWFVSYSYYDKIDSSHCNWNKIKSVEMRKSVYNKSKSYHKNWLQEVLSMNPLKLKTNKIGLDPNATKAMAKKLLEVLDE